MQLEDLQHGWNVTEEEARAIQARLSQYVIAQNSFELADVHSVAGIDVSLREEGQAAVVVLSYPELQIIERTSAVRKLEFPYVPGLLSFREMPVVLDALATLKHKPDLIMVDGQGYAHPRRFGIACHVGVITGIPSIGVAKSILYGQMLHLSDVPGSTAPIIDRAKKDVIGTALRAKKRTNPLIISIGSGIELDTAVEIVKNCLRGYRLPEPTRQAHLYAGQAADTPPDPTDNEGKSLPEVIQDTMF